MSNIPWYVRDLWKELVEYEENSLVIFAGRLTEGGMMVIDDSVFIEQINTAIASGKVNIVFYNAHETLILPEISKIYGLLPKLNTKPSNIYYMTASLNAVEIHERLCKQFNWDPLTVVAFNSFAVFVKNYTYSIKHGAEYQLGKREKTFLCMNRMPRLSRVCLLVMMHERNLIEGSHYSFYDTVECLPPLGYEIQKHLSPAFAERIRISMQQLAPSLPLRLTLDNVASNPVDIHSDDIALFNETYFSVITETAYLKDHVLNDQSSFFFTEKLYNAVLLKHPFVLVSMPNSLSVFNSLGYRSFHPYINESYDTIVDDEERMSAIVDEVERLCNFTDEEWIAWQHNIKDIVEHNYNVLMNSANSPLNTVSLSKE